MAGQKRHFRQIFTVGEINSLCHALYHSRLFACTNSYITHCRKGKKNKIKKAYQVPFKINTLKQEHKIIYTALGGKGIVEFKLNEISGAIQKCLWVN